jgi:hypothetical protein
MELKKKKIRNDGLIQNDQNLVLFLNKFFTIYVILEIFYRGKEINTLPSNKNQNGGLLYM